MNVTESIRAQYGPNSGYIEELYSLFQRDPALVGETWAAFFSSLEQLPPAGDSHDPGQLTIAYVSDTPTSASSEPPQQGTANGYYVAPAADAGVQERIYRMISAFRGRGHLKAQVNPLSKGIQPPPQVEDIDTDFYKYSEEQLQQTFACAGLGRRETMRLADIIEELHRVYCGSIGFEFTHILHQEERLWLQKKIEGRFQNGYRLNREQKLRRLQKIIDADAFESQLHTKYVGHKRFSLQGCETLIPMLDSLLEEAGEVGVKRLILGMPHRGRLNVLMNTLGKPLELIFSEFEDQNIHTALGSGDVKYHMGFESNYISPSGQSLNLFLAPNPSHLEFIDPIVEGMVRALQDFDYDRNREVVLPVLLHGDAAFVGQGVVWETLNLSCLEGYCTGGTIHIVVNNQIGFTTNPDESRSTTYCTDMAKAVGAPIFHVNCENVEACCWVIKTALEFRNRYDRDVIIDLIGYRKYGHNEGDDPSFTQPLQYSEIRTKKTIAALYSEHLISEGVITEDEVSEYVDAFRERFERAHEESTAEGDFGEVCTTLGRLREPQRDTGVALETLHRIADTLITYPVGFIPHPKLQRILEKRVQTLRDGRGLDWGFCEALAYGSLLLDGCSIRLSGQDCGRGTFSQRHLLFCNHESAERHMPLTLLSEDEGAGNFEVLNSPLSEAAVVGFEFGYAAMEKDCLVLWEAQFGDFTNGAQVITDQFISSSEAKWNQLSGLVLLLPHGYEGQGPEHSSARLERFLQLCAEGNMTVCYPSSACQYFHLLRRQGLTKLKRPLVVMTPKSLLRLPAAACEIMNITSGKFQTLMVEDYREEPEHAVFVSGKAVYDIKAALDKLDEPNCKLVRVEQLYPFPKDELAEILTSKRLKTFTWVQEEPQNMGAFAHVENVFENELGVELAYIGRQANASTATGSSKRHAAEQRAIVEKVLERVQQ